MGKISLKNISLSEYTPENLEYLMDLTKKTKNTRAKVCIERAKYFTQYLKDMSSDSDPVETRFARAVNHYLSHREPVFFDDNLLAGSTTSKDFGAPVYPEFGTGLTIWPELDTISTRSENPLILSKEDAEYLNFEVYPYWMDRTILERARKEYKNPLSLQLFQRLIFFIAGKPGCISHTVPYYAKALDHGLEYISNEAAEKERELSKKGNLSEEEKRSLLFYQAVQIAMDGICKYAENLSRKAAELAKNEKDNTFRKKNLEKISEVCAQVPAKPARTFREAVNAIWLIQVGIHGENINMAMSPGRLDQVLYKFYKADMDKGILTEKEAIEIAGCLWLKLNDNTNLVPSTASKLFGGAGTVPAVTLGGVDAEGEDAVNDLTYIMLRVTELLQTRDPNVNARYHYEKNTTDYRNRVAEVINNTKAVPALHNDVFDIKSLENQGFSPEHARDYAIIGCVELASAGRSYNASSSIIFNLTAPLEMALYNGIMPSAGSDQVGPKTGAPADFKTIDSFWEALKAQLSFLIGQAVDLNNKFGYVYQNMQPTPLLSAFFEGPIKKGKDLIFGGAVYNSSGATHIGFSDTVDSLCAIEQAVFIDKKCTFEELLNALKKDFKGEEKLHQYLIHKAPKYGDCSEVSTRHSQNLIRFLYQTYHDHKNYRDGRYWPAYWTMTNHAGMGQLMGALPNGRMANRILASGITNVSQEADNLTKSLNAVAALGSDYIPGGQALNLKYPVIANKQDMDTFCQTAEAFFRSGGIQVQFNIRSYDDLIQAYNDCRNKKKNAGDFLVRVSGYSAYFKDLNEAMQLEIITRSEYNLKNGTLDIFPAKHADMIPYNPAKKTIFTILKNAWDTITGIVSGFFSWISKKLRKKNPILNKIISESSEAVKNAEKFINSLESGFVDDSLFVLLELLRLVFIADKDFRKNIDGFSGRYLFNSMDKKIEVAAIFKDSKLTVENKAIDNTDVTVTFKDVPSLMKFALSKDPNILSAVLDQTIVIDGNLNYIYKFGYMAQHLATDVKDWFH